MAFPLLFSFFAPTAQPRPTSKHDDMSSFTELQQRQAVEHQPALLLWFVTWSFWTCFPPAGGTMGEAWPWAASSVRISVIRSAVAAGRCCWWSMDREKSDNMSGCLGESALEAASGTSSAAGNTISRSCLSPSSPSMSHCFSFTSVGNGLTRGCGGRDFLCGLAGRNCTFHDLHRIVASSSAGRSAEEAGHAVDVARKSWISA